MTARYIVGDVFDALAKMPDDSVDMVFTSPPFLGLRSYLPADHPMKDKELGTEPNPAEFIDALLSVTEALERVLAPHGSLCMELGDTYSGARGYGSEEGNPLYGERAEERWREARVEKRFKKADDGWPESKSLCMIPELYRIALAYGRNPLSGRITPRWRVRNVVRWCRPNPPVGFLADKSRPATSDIVVACKSRTRYFDLDAVRTEHSEPIRENVNRPKRQTENGVRGTGGDDRGYVLRTGNPAGAPPLDHWWFDDVYEQDAVLLPTSPFKGAHYATFPPALVVQPLLAMCPEKVCTVCGEPSRRITEKSVEYEQRRAEMDEPWETSHLGKGWGPERLTNHTIPRRPSDTPGTAEFVTLGWTDCGHESYRPGAILDCFGGSGTVGQVGTGHGRNCVLIDLDHRNAQLAMERIGGFLCEVSSLDDPMPEWLCSPKSHDDALQDGQPS